MRQGKVKRQQSIVIDQTPAMRMTRRFEIVPSPANTAAMEKGFCFDTERTG
jgi:hypothetical protein